MSNLLERIQLSPKQYVDLCREYDVRMRSIFRAPIPPTYYAVIEGKDSKELLAYLWFDAARQQWAMFSPEEATEEIEALFS